MTSPVAKFIVYLIGGIGTAAGQALTWGLVPASARPWVALIVGILTFAATGAGVYFVPNTPSGPPKA